VAPERIRLPAAPAPVTMSAARLLGLFPLQDFFGCGRPLASRAESAVSRHLLRLINAGKTTRIFRFWERLYPQVRRELSRRYRAHKWPEKPG